jgi:cyclohexyl-isocyanide hydratase
MVDRQRCVSFEMAHKNCKLDPVQGHTDGDYGFHVRAANNKLVVTFACSTEARAKEARAAIIAKTLQLVSSDRGLSILPTCTFDDAPSLNLICVPGGAGVVDALADVATVDFIRRQGAQAQFVTSVCIGAFLLGAAGLLKGRRAATHWAYVDLLPLVGASHEKSRIVRDGNVFTSGGVTSGIEPPRVCRRPFRLSHAASFCSSSVA